MSSTVDVLWMMSVVGGTRGVGVCEMCMCLAQGGVVDVMMFLAGIPL